MIQFQTVVLASPNCWHKKTWQMSCDASFAPNQLMCHILRTWQIENWVDNVSCCLVKYFFQLSLIWSLPFVAHSAIMLWILDNSHPRPYPSSCYAIAGICCAPLITELNIVRPKFSRKLCWICGWCYSSLGSIRNASRQIWCPQINQITSWSTSA